jgi:chromatin segregation and condensation protein Rec8/ScpA/Scc1 (kleisin family)
MDFFQTLRFMLEKFMRDMDIAYAGRIIFSLSRELRTYANNIFYGMKMRKRKVYNNKVEKIAADVIPRRVVRRPVTAEELKDAMYWALERLKEKSGEEMTIKVEDFYNILDSIYRRIVSVLSNRRMVSIREISTGKEDIVNVFVSILFLEMEGRVVTYQDDPFGELYISLPGMGESKEAS